ncbi:putative fermentation associated protein [Neofusicoccum parvum UCRNP2]|uniref:Putative fermentation associated protein n=1 Tax=Botryosphaeria parva (strain UCR-NP2) TaxID=1287680 RepID=R1H0H3_BOTPV|nr:putative fermentation associated protein [Neofusicoccum parvum UCRNP2]
MASGGLTAQPLDAHRGLLWQFLVELLVCGILTVFFLFYFNRLFATLVSYAIRAYTWHNYRAYIDIQSLQISLLGGRVFWKDIRYHGHNQTILIHGGYITWRFWYRKVKETELFCNGQVTEKPGLAQAESVFSSPSRGRSRSVGREEDGGKQKTKQLPCRISIKITGMEVFLYNRSPAYDSILDNFARAMGASNMKKPTANDWPPSEQSTVEPTVSDKAQSALHRRNTSGSSKRTVQRHGTGAEEKHPTRHETEETPKPPEIPSFLRLFPIRIDCNKGAVLVGNESTPSIISLKFDKANGELSAAHAGPLDIYKQLFNFDFEHPVMHMKPNHDYKNPQLATAARYLDDDDHNEHDEWGGVDFEEEAVLRIPLREKSKDWKWKGKAQNVAGNGKNTESENFDPLAG